VVGDAFGTPSSSEGVASGVLELFGIAQEFELLANVIFSHEQLLSLFPLSSSHVAYWRLR
jgi:hypothetical protein